MATGTINVSGLTASATWLATKSEAIGVKLTNNLTLSAGVWLVIITFPITSDTGLTSLYSDGVSFVITPNYFPIVQYGRYAVLIRANMDNAYLYLQSASSGTVNFDYIDRGNLSAVKIA